ncbi:MAG: hypothetical protein ABJH72_25205 [Reichenbachiella sp.]|uniref:hypothetical protein n=1 Tax=Reichenbachiella sp. TaxID=2184521 RepID=UPI003267E852
MTNFEITYQLSIDPNGIVRNGTPYDFKLNPDTYAWMAELYRHLKIEYPKFHKMDHLCKLAFLGVELLKESVDCTSFDKDRVALVFENSYASLDTDQKHQKNVQSQKTSPAVFVYTLPNILMGEIAIRNQWYGENLFVLNDEFDVEGWKQTATTLLKANKADVIIGGWAEVLDQHFDLRLHMIQRR